MKKVTQNTRITQQNPQKGNEHRTLEILNYIMKGQHEDFLAAAQEYTVFCGGTQQNLDMERVWHPCSLKRGKNIQ